MKKIVSLLMAIALSATLFAGCTSQNPSNPSSVDGESVPVSGEPNTSLKEDGKFIVGVDDSFAPMGFRDEKNNVVGFDIDMATEAGSRLGLEVVIQPIEWSNKELELNNDKIDVIWNGFTITEKRKKEVLFTKPYLKNNQVIVVTAASTIAKKDDLVGKQIGVQSGSSAVEALNADPIGSKIEKANEYPDNVLALNDLKIGRVDAVVIDEVVAKYYHSKEPSAFKLLDESLAAEEYGIGVKKGNEKLLNALQKALNEMGTDGTSAKISKTWFGEDIVLK